MARCSRAGGRAGAAGAGGAVRARSERSRGWARAAGAKCGQLRGAGEAQPGRPGKRLRQWASRMQMSRRRRANGGGGGAAQRDWLARGGGGGAGARLRPRHSCARAVPRAPAPGNTRSGNTGNRSPGTAARPERPLEKRPHPARAGTGPPPVPPSRCAAGAAGAGMAALK